MAGEKQGDSKRKRDHINGVEDGVQDGPTPKRPNHALLDDRARERLRGDVRAIYEAYESLYHAPPDAAEPNAFQLLLDAAQGAHVHVQACLPRSLVCHAACIRIVAACHGLFLTSPCPTHTVPVLAGNVAARRLAARLIPRLIGRFPAQADTAAAILIDLHESRAPPDALSLPELEEAVRADALEGLRAVLQSAAAGREQQHLDSRGAVPAVVRILDHLLR